MERSPGSDPPLAHTVWRSRNYLPHCDGAGLIQAITFRLADSLPRSLLEQWRMEIAFEDDSRRKAEMERRVAHALDQGLGACHIQDQRIASLVQGSLLYFDQARYNLLAWCIMPNHVHVLAEILPGHTLASIVHSWKSYTAKEANRILQRSGAFWQVEYHDRYIRDESHLANAKRYIENNPVKAGLVAAPELWPWSSCRKNAGLG